MNRSKNKNVSHFQIHVDEGGVTGVKASGHLPIENMTIAFIGGMWMMIQNTFYHILEYGFFNTVLARVSKI